MYISRLHIENWRSYRDVTFDFKHPVAGKPLILIGAMNGVGKTSFLMALYLGLFGRFGLKFVEQHKNFIEDKGIYYRGAIEKFRKRDAEPEEPTIIDITISPTDKETQDGLHEVRVVRKWFFSNNFKLRQGSASEEVLVYDNGILVGVVDHELGQDHEKIQSLLFRSDIVPAFFFDGEQAQSVIDAAGRWEVRKAVDVLFGTSIVSRSIERMIRYSTSLSQSMGGKRKVDEQEKQHQANKVALQSINIQIEKSEDEANSQRNELESIKAHRDMVIQKLNELGGDREPRLMQLDVEIQQLREGIKSSKLYVYNELGNLSISLALVKNSDKLIQMLEKEINREKHDAIRSSTESKIHEVISRALPEPHIQDSLLCDLDTHAWESLRSRIVKAIEWIYDPPPANCASEIVLAFLNNNQRQGLIEKSSKVLQADPVRHRITELQRLEQELLDKLQERDVYMEGYSDLSDLIGQLKTLNEQCEVLNKSLAEKESELKSFRSSKADLLLKIDKHIELKSNTKDARSLLDISEQLISLLESWKSKLYPLAMQRVVSLTTQNFLRIADDKFQGGRIEIREIDGKGSSEPIFINKLGDVEYFESMSGFERRSFGVAFSLALTELTNFRAPLVIDSPLGNADSEYRSRLLKALAEADLDQIILLTHDEEVTEDLHDKVISDRIELNDGTYFLITYDDENSEAIVSANHYFY